MDPTTLNPVRAQLNRLRGEAELLASRLEQAAEALLRIGAPPEATLARDLRQFDGELRTFLAGGWSAAGSNGNNLWESLEASVRRQEQRTVVVPQLRAVIELRHQSQEPFEPLEPVRRDAAGWLASLDSDAELPAELLDALLSGRHATLALVRLATQPGALSDSNWVADQNLITESYGRTLALAAARGQLQSGRTRPVIAVAPVRSATPVPPAPHEITRSAPTPPAARDRAALEDRSVRERAAPRSPARPATAEAPTEVAPLPPAAHADGAALLRDAVRRTQSAVGAARRRELSDLIRLLLKQDRSGLAWQLNRSVEALYGGSVSPGADLVRCVALGRFIRRPGGQLVQALVSRLAEREWTVAGAVAPRWSPEQRRLAVAALLPAVVLAQEDHLLPLLRHAAGDDAEVAPLVTSLAAESAGPGGSESAPDVQTLQRQVRDWQAAWTDRSIEFRKAEALFARRHWSVRTSLLQRAATASGLISGWLYTLRLGSGLIAPVLADSSADKSEVRRTLSRIESRLLVGSRADYPAGIDAIIVPSEPMRAYLQEAAQWARRWLQGAAPAGTVGDSTQPRPAGRPRAELRQPLDDCRARVLARAASSGEPAEQASWACLLQSLEQIRASLSGEQPALEPDAAAILGGELSRRRIVQLGPNAAPTCSDTDLIERLLQSLAQQPAAVSSDDERATACGVPAPTRDAPDVALSLEEELNAMASALESAAESGLINERDHAGLSARLCAVWNGSSALGESANRETVLNDLRHRLAARGVGYLAGETVPARPRLQEESPPVAGGSFLLDEEAL